MTSLDRLRLLQTRIREATEPDRELDLAICKAFGRAPADAIWDIPEGPYGMMLKRSWTTPAYVKHMQEFKRGVDAAFAEMLGPEETAAKIKTLNREWDFRNAPPFGSAPHYTADPDGLGACVALLDAVLPGYRGSLTWNMLRTNGGTSFADVGVPVGYEGPSPWPEGYTHHDNRCLALLYSITTAKISEEESSTQKVTP